MRDYQTFEGKDTRQLDAYGKPADPEAWYYEPCGYEGDVLWSEPFDTEEQCNKAARRECEPVRSFDHGKMH